MTDRLIKRAIRIGASHGWTITKHGDALIADKGSEGLYCESVSRLINAIREQSNY